MILINHIIQTYHNLLYIIIINIMWQFIIGFTSGIYIGTYYDCEPTIDIIKFTRTITIANKESIICGWNLIEKELKKNKTNFTPVDSEHFSLWFGLKNFSPATVKYPCVIKTDIIFSLKHLKVK